MAQGRKIRLAGVMLLALLLGACGSATDDSSAAREDAADGDRGEITGAAREYRWRARSQAGLYQISIRPERAEPRIGPLHAWLVRVASETGAPVEAARLVFDGGMPEHGHGFETSPRTTDSLGDGVFRVDGVRFHMAGSWRLRVDVVGPEGVDFAVFDVNVGP